jgi:hypothetical protein
MAARLSASRAGRPLPPGIFLVLIYVGGCVHPRAIMRLEGLGQFKDPMTSFVIESATFRLVAWCLLCSRVVIRYRGNVFTEQWKLV